jgi:hypothetical protein
MENHVVAWLLILGALLAAAKGCESDDVRVARLQSSPGRVRQGLNSAASGARIAGAVSLAIRIGDTTRKVGLITETFL